MASEEHKEDRQLIETIRREYAPGALTPTVRAQLRQGVDRRLARRRRGLIAASVLTAAATAALAAWLVLVNPEPVPSVIERPGDALALDAWTESVLFEETAVDDDDALLGDEDPLAAIAEAEADELPAEYEMLAALVDG